MRDAYPFLRHLGAGVFEVPRDISAEALIRLLMDARQRGNE